MSGMKKGQGGSGHGESSGLKFKQYSGSQLQNMPLNFKKTNIHKEILQKPELGPSDDMMNCSSSIQFSERNSYLVAGAASDGEKV